MNYTKNQLASSLKKLNGKGYKAYKSLKATYIYKDAFKNRPFSLIFDHIQGDPFAKPSPARIRVKRCLSDFPDYCFSSQSRIVAFCDYITRKFSNAVRNYSKGIRGSGKSGLFLIDAPGQKIIYRTSALLSDDDIEVRFSIGLPANGRRIDGKVVEIMLLKELPEIINNTLFFDSKEEKKLKKHLETNEDADALRQMVKDSGLKAFIANGSILPRKSGISDLPLPLHESVIFNSPKSFEKAFNLPNIGSISGMGIQTGVTLFVGGGFHGKSTVLNALEAGIYNHIPDDGREFVVTVDDAVKIRACDGRSISGTDISPFINNLPFQKDTRYFSTENASGSTSQAASISEAIEIGATLLLMDEDTSATNFMIRDHRMQQLVAQKDEPITPYIDRIKWIYETMGISTILVMGGSGDYFTVADTVIKMTEFSPSDATKEAASVAKQFPTQRRNESRTAPVSVNNRFPGLNRLFSRYKPPAKVAVYERYHVAINKLTVFFQDVEQIAEKSQSRAIAYAILNLGNTFCSNNDLKKQTTEKMTLRHLVEKIESHIQTKGLDCLAPLNGELVAFRKYELAFVINRIRGLEIEQFPKKSSKSDGQRNKPEK